MQMLVRPDSNAPNLVLAGRCEAYHAIKLVQFLLGPIDHSWTLLIDFSHVTHLNDTFLSVLLDAKAVALKHGASFHLCNPSAAARRTFEHLGVVGSLTDPSLLTREEPDLDTA
jgi:anti-anti-sigma regulatory factor